LNLVTKFEAKHFELGMITFIGISTSL